MDVTDFRWLIKKYARSYSLSSYLSQEELEQQAYLIAADALASWDPSQGSLPARMKYKICTGLRDYVKKFGGTVLPFHHTENFQYANRRDPEKTYLSKEILNGLSEDARKMIEIVLTEIDYSLPAKTVRGELKKKLRQGDHPWRFSRIWKGLEELRTVAASLE